MNQIDTQVLEILDEFSLDGVGDGAFSHQSEGGVASPCARFHYEFPDVAGASDDQNLAFLRH